jgi:transposase
MRGSRTKRVKAVKEETLIVTVDIGMASNTGYCTSVDGRDIKPFKFDNTREGLERFWSMIVVSKNRFRCSDVMVGYESTGPYAEPLIHYLIQRPVTIVQVNPMHTKRIKELNDNSPLKTDDKDPRVIADVLRLGHALSVVIPEGDAAYLRRLNHARERHVGMRTALLNQLQQWVFLIFPEFKRVFKDIKVKTAQHILTRYTTPERIGRLNPGELGEEMRKQSMGKFGVQQAELLIRLARDTIGIQEGIAGLVLDIRHILMQLEGVHGFVAEIEAEMEKTLERIPYRTRILSMKGLGVVTCILTMAKTSSSVCFMYFG